jgi:hypothetical protein
LWFFIVVEGVYIYSKGAREPQSITPEGRGGGAARLIVIEAIGIAFVVHAVEAA